MDLNAPADPRVLPDSPAVPAKNSKRLIAAWSAWDWGSASFNAVITTFVFTTWLASSAFVDPELVAAAEAAGGEDGPAKAAVEAAIALHNQWLGWGLAIAGLFIALIAPVSGARSDRAGRRRRWLAIHTAIVIVVSLAMVLVEPDPNALTQNLVFGILLLSVGNIFFELAMVNYNAMLAQVARPGTRGRVSGIGWGAGYIGGIVLLLILFVGFINPEVGWFGVTGENGMDIRVSVGFSALWFALFALPVLFMVPEPKFEVTADRPTIIQSYRALGRRLAQLWRSDRQLLRYLIASAVYRDGLAGVFTFGAVIAAGTFGFSASEVIVFAIAANLVAGLSTIGSGFLDDLLGPRRIIITSLIGLVVAGLAVFFGRDGGPTIFWIFGLALCLFVGPVQSASRTLLSAEIPPGQESEVFGLYATTGRAASFLTAAAWAIAIGIGGAQFWGILGIVTVLGIGLALFLPIQLGKRPSAAEAAAASSSGK